MMTQKREWYMPRLRKYVVTFADGRVERFEGTRLGQSPEGDLLIWNGMSLLTGFGRGEYVEVREVEEEE
jgi:hypothetical protein